MAALSTAVMASVMRPLAGWAVRVAVLQSCALCRALAGSKESVQYCTRDYRRFFFVESAKYRNQKQLSGQCPVCLTLHALPNASQNSREIRASLVYSSVWELGWALIPAPSMPSVHAPWSAQPPKNDKKIRGPKRVPRHQRHPSPAMPAACRIS